jgi:hypothetical protein
MRFSLCKTLILSALFLFVVNHASASLILKHPNYTGLTNGLVGYWSFDGKDLAGNVAYDGSDIGNYNSVCFRIVSTGIRTNLSNPDLVVKDPIETELVEEVLQFGLQARMMLWARLVHGGSVFQVILYSANTEWLDSWASELPHDWEFSPPG